MLEGYVEESICKHNGINHRNWKLHAGADTVPRQFYYDRYSMSGDNEFLNYSQKSADVYKTVI